VPAALAAAAVAPVSVEEARCDRAVSLPPNPRRGLSSRPAKAKAQLVRMACGESSSEPEMPKPPMSNDALCIEYRVSASEVGMN
jgi:hypothetical protein